MPADSDVPNQDRSVVLDAIETAPQSGQDTVAEAAFLYRASRQLAGSLDAGEILHSAARAIVPELADWAQIAVFGARATTLVTAGGDGTAPRQCTASQDAAGLRRVRSTGEVHQLRLDDAGARDGDLAELIPLPRLCAEAAASGPTEALVIPLVARGTAFGALVLLDCGGAGGSAGGGADSAGGGAGRAGGGAGAAGGRRRFDGGANEMAEEFADRVARTLDAAMLYEERAYIAGVLQRSLRPPRLPEFPGLALASAYRTAVEHIDIGGDFFDVHGSADDALAVVGDVCGKGVEAAVLTGRSRQTIRAAAALDRSPARILTVLNEVLHEDADERFVTAVCVRLRPSGDGGRLLDVAIAGHPAPLLVRADGEVTEVAAEGVLSGVLADAEYTEVSTLLAPGDTVLLYTDGIYEARGSSGFYGMTRLTELVGGLGGADPQALCCAVESDVVEHLAGGAHDDMAVLAIQCTPG